MISAIFDKLIPTTNDISRARSLYAEISDVDLRFQARPYVEGVYARKLLQFVVTDCTKLAADLTDDSKIRFVAHLGKLHGLLARFIPSTLKREIQEKIDFFEDLVAGINTHYLI